MITALGEALIDLMPAAADGKLWHARPGGAPMNAVGAEVVDTVGADHSFSGGLLCALHEAGVADAEALDGIDADGWGRALHFAGRVAAIACARVGADPPWRHELAT